MISKRLKFVFFSNINVNLEKKNYIEKTHKKEKNKKQKNFNLIINHLIINFYLFKLTFFINKLHNFFLCLIRQFF